MVPASGSSLEVRTKEGHPRTRESTMSLFFTPSRDKFLGRIILAAWGLRNHRGTELGILVLGVGALERI